MRRILMIPLLCLIGCAAGTMVVITGKDFDASNIDGTIKKGKTTMLKILEVYGQPLQKNVSGFGETWVYRYAVTKGESTVLPGYARSSSGSFEKSLTIDFDTLGIVRTLSYSISGDPSDNRLNTTRQPGIVGIWVNAFGTILTVDGGSPAAKAGILVGDRLTRVDGEELETGDAEKIVKRISGKPFTKVEIEISRGDQTLTFVLTREAR